MVRVLNIGGIKIINYMKTKIQFTESYFVSIKKKSIEIDTDDYPELKGLEGDDLLDYLKENGENIIYKDNDDPNSEYTSTLFDVLVDQEEIYSREKNNDFSIVFDED